MARAARGEVSPYIPPLALAATVGVRKSFSRCSITARARVIISLVSAPGIEADHRELMVRMVELARDRNVDLADAYLALQAAARGETVCSFDESDFRRLPVNGRCPNEALPRFPCSATPPRSSQDATPTHCHLTLSAS